MPPLILLQNVGLTFGGTPLLESVELSVSERERLCLVGRNGSGKSTLLKIAAGEIAFDGGTRFLQPGVTVRYLPQVPDLSGHATTLAFVEAGLAEGDDPYRARYLLETLGLTGNEAPARLSGGEMRRAALARVLAPEPDILLLDEPTNHLDVAAIEGLEQALQEMRSAIVTISHDRRFLENLSSATVWLDRGRTLRLDKGFAAFEAWRDQVLEEEELARHKLDRKIVNEEHWLRYGVSARRKRNQKRLGDLHQLRADRRTAAVNRPQGGVTLAVQDAKLSGKLVIEAKDIAKSYGERAIVRQFSARIERGDRIGIVGPNGAGKTTLINLLTGALEPDAGSVRLGANLEIATLDQRRESLGAEATIAEILTDGRGDTVLIGGEARHVIGYMKDFLFRPEQARTPVKSLSGGERGRLMLARALARPSNFLVLDEPTNDLDLETLDLLQEMLAAYPGTLLLVSHDRDFLDRVVTSVIAFEGDGRWQEYAGGYSDMVAQRGHGVAALDAPMPAARSNPLPPPAAPLSSPAQKKKLSFAEQHALKTLPARMEKLAAELMRLEEMLAAPDLYRKDPATFTRTTMALATARADLAAAEEEWLRTELLREEMGRG
ncbi:MAG TPA: ATP-binding cassette domain-containing protein [Bauldia sp.]